MDAEAVQRLVRLAALYRKACAAERRSWWGFVRAKVLGQHEPASHVSDMVARLTAAESLASAVVEALEESGVDLKRVDTEGG